MFTTNTSGNLADTSEISRLLAQQISAAVHTHSHPSTDDTRLYRISIPLPAVDLMDWLSAQQQETKLYWSGRASESSIAAVGTADRQTSSSTEDYRRVVNRLRKLLSPHDEDTRYFGGFQFQPNAAIEPAWRSFGTYQFILPRFELHGREDHTVLFCNIRLPEDQTNLSSILADVDRLRFQNVSSDRDLPSPTRRSNTPPRDAWQKNVARVLDRLETTPLKKAVLARRTTFDVGTTIEPVQLLRQLRDHTPACFHFLLQTTSSTAFVGASPERLYRRTGNILETEAVAGTRGRGNTDEEDRQLARELSDSEKDFQEHRFVRQYVREAVAPLCESLDEEEKLAIMKLATKQHLVTRFRGSLHAAVRDDQLLDALHPTPAVGGYPTGEALPVISSLESFDRGWYAAPVGWISTNAAEFAVAIRSGLVEDNHLHLYAGAGIVAGSDPAGEWDELEQKIFDFVQLLTTTANRP